MCEVGGKEGWLYRDTNQDNETTYTHQFGTNLTETSQKAFNGIIDAFFNLGFAVGDPRIGKTKSFQFGIKRRYRTRTPYEKNRVENALKGFPHLTCGQFQLGKILFFAVHSYSSF